MRAGSLKHQVLIQEKTVTGTGDRGQPVYTWNTLITVPASISPLNGRKAEIARQLVASATHTVTLRYYAGLTETMRLLYGSRVFNIGFIKNLDELNFTQELLVTEQKNGI